MIKRTKSYWASLINLQLPDRQCCNMVSLFEIIRLKMKKKWATFFLQPGSSFLETLYWVILKNPTFSNINIKQHSDIYWQNIYLFLFAFSVFYICLSMCKRSLATCAAPGSFVPLEFLCQCTQANGWKRLEGISLLMCLTLSHFDTQLGVSLGGVHKAHMHRRAHKTTLRLLLFQVWAALMRVRRRSMGGYH